MKHEAAIEVKDLNVLLNQNLVLENINFTINDGDYVAIIGPNGAGKTTLFKTILGLIPPSSGSIKLFGHNLASFNKKYRIGYIPQKASSSLINFPATVSEIVKSGRTARRGLFKQFTREDSEKTEWAMKIANIEKYRDRLVHRLSGGELQKVFIARALATEPKILFLDEPTAGIDMASQEKFYDFLKEINTNLKLTIIIVTHEVDVAVHRAQSVLCLNRQLICHIKSSELMHSSYLEKLYGKHAHIVHHTHYNEA